MRHCIDILLCIMVLLLQCCDAWESVCRFSQINWRQFPVIHSVDVNDSQPLLCCRENAAGSPVLAAPQHCPPHTDPPKHFTSFQLFKVSLRILIFVSLRAIFDKVLK